MSIVWCDARFSITLRCANASCKAGRHSIRCGCASYRGAEMSFSFRKLGRADRWSPRVDIRSRFAQRAALSTILIIISVPILSQVAVATPPSPEIKEKCSQEIRSFCLRPWRLTPDAISQCVEDNRAKLSADCQGFWEVASGCQKEMREICGWKFPLLIRSCFAESRAKFSSTCQATLGIEQ
jgi:hypothetical protein